MSYSDYTISDIKDKFNIKIEQKTNIFPNIEKEKISDSLNEILEENIPLALAIHTEKARSEMIVTPILIELRKILEHRISLFSGVEFNVDKEKGLNGICDYIISLSEEQLYVSSPVVLIVEAKNDNIKSGLAQCAAEMVASKIFNEQKKCKIKNIYGVVTTGSNWRFLKLDDRLYIDIKEYYIEQIGTIMGILLHIIRSEIKKADL
ncbi:conserved hypothetical protein [Desulfamplus magnetovallimortis]|uniref:Type I restriction enzyme R protein N-terminal domain-containing protein n=1 Tax=Desulfamplus magnetovallimortis TaxID=1246637 RepID=A0A1W1HDH2_9BACT|nr:hypothetical protein [Desulfamplus magnetovallimortis]SLM30486.1 conserved hypothetical protein [Desulfamplus magnetovallimortis]